MSVSYKAFLSESEVQTGTSIWSQSHTIREALLPHSNEITKNRTDPHQKLLLSISKFVSFIQLVK